jgi:hypothetical protein
LISISQQFYLELEWSPGAITGTATVTVKVKVAFFSKSVHLTLERTFAGSGDPTFADMLTKADWATYCDAFADEG